MLQNGDFVQKFKYAENGYTQIPQGEMGVISDITWNDSHRDYCLVSSFKISWLDSKKVEVFEIPEDIEQEHTSIEDFMCINPKFWVNVYLEDRAYGGPEEGGWWYNCASVEKSVQCSSEEEAQKLYRKMFLEVEEMNIGRRPISSVLSEGVYAVYLEQHKGESYPKHTPHYS